MLCPASNAGASSLFQCCVPLRALGRTTRRKEAEEKKGSIVPQSSVKVMPMCGDCVCLKGGTLK